MAVAFVASTGWATEWLDSRGDYRCSATERTVLSFDGAIWREDRSEPGQVYWFVTDGPDRYRVTTERGSFIVGCEVGDFVHEQSCEIGGSGISFYLDIINRVFVMLDTRPRSEPTIEIEVVAETGLCVRAEFVESEE
ncbi:MAG: hypothetical protein KIS96_10970 [Bauldia sp.]|nr:hypothetical protein [Bauldia sp.]